MAADNPFLAAVRLFDAGRFAEAADYARDRLRELPDDGNLMQVYGTACCRLGNHAEAREALERASALVPLHPLARCALADAYARAGPEDLAALLYEFLGEREESSAMWPATAARLGALGRYESALEVCRRIVEREPNHQALFGVAYYLERLGAPPEEIIPHLAMAMDLAPHLLGYRVSLALAWVRAGSPEMARDLLAVVPLDDVCCQHGLRRALEVFRQVGDWERFRTCLRRLSERGRPSGPAPFYDPAEEDSDEHR